MYTFYSFNIFFVQYFSGVKKISIFPDEKKREKCNESEITMLALESQA